MVDVDNETLKGFSGSSRARALIGSGVRDFAEENMGASRGEPGLTGRHRVHDKSGNWGFRGVFRARFF